MQVQEKKVFHKNFSLQVKEIMPVAETDTIRVSGYASVFGNADAYGEIVDKGAFSQVINSDRKIKVLFQHDTDEPIGIITRLEEDNHGLWFDCEIATDLPTGKKVETLLKRGIIDGVSIGYWWAKSYEDVYFDENGNLHLKNIDLFEISIVTVPANDQATVQTVKSFIENDSENKHLQKMFAAQTAFAKSLSDLRNLLKA